MVELSEAIRLNDYCETCKRNNYSLAKHYLMLLILNGGVVILIGIKYEVAISHIFAPLIQRDADVVVVDRFAESVSE